MKKVRIGSGSAYWGDMLEPAVELCEKGDIQYIGFDHLAELTMSVLQRQKNKNPEKGYIEDIIPWMRAILPVCHKKGIKIVTNAGGVNPEAAADAVAKLAKEELGITGIKIGVVLGDDVMGCLDDLIAKGYKLTNLDNGDEDISKIRDRIVAANAYIGADKILEALKQGADIVIAGRVSDTAVFVGPMMYEFGWEFDENTDWNKIGAAVTIGHTIECAENVTGGLSSIWNQAKDIAHIGFPIAEVYENGDCILSKVDGSGGILNQWTVKEQLTYEVLDPNNYIMPDAIADFTTVKVEEIGKDKVKISNMSGKKRPDTLKVQIGYQNGWVGEGLIVLPWPDAYAKAKNAEQTVRARFKDVGLQADEIHFDYVGVNMLHGSVAPEPTADLNEVGLRITARCPSREEASKVGREATHLWTLGGCGAAYGTPYKPRPLISLWPTLVPRDCLDIKLIMKEVK